ncbi:MAG: PPC domain-containing protein [Anaerolineae bacterium]
MNGQVDSSALKGYLLGASAGQRMQISLTSPGGNVYLTVLSPSGTVLANAAMGEQSLDRFLPETGDYIIQVSTPGGLTNFTLAVSVT